MVYSDTTYWREIDLAQIGGQSGYRPRAALREKKAIRMPGTSRLEKSKP